MPGFAGVWDLVAAVVPEPVLDLGRRLVRDDRALARVDSAGRAAYEARLERQRNRP